MNSARGFTLIEIILVITVLSALTTFSIAGFSNISRSQYLKEAALDFKSNLRYAQNQAINGVKPSSCLGDLAGYSIVVQTSSSNYSLQIKCSGNASPITLKTFPPIANVSYNNVASTSMSGTSTNISSGNLEIRFLPFGGTEFYDGQTKIVDTVGSYIKLVYGSLPGSAYKIDVKSSGGIYESKTTPD